MRNEETQYVRAVENLDYQRNVNWGSKFTKNYNDVYNDREMAIRMDKNTDGIKYFFMFSFFVHGQYGNELSYGNPVDPNQDTENFMIQFKNTYAGYLKLQKRWEEKRKSAIEFKAFDPAK